MDNKEIEEQLDNLDNRIIQVELSVASIRTSLIGITKTRIKDLVLSGLVYFTSVLFIIGFCVYLLG